MRHQNNYPPPALSAPAQLPVLATAGYGDSQDADAAAGLSLNQLVSILRSNWKQALATWVAVTVLAAGILQILPKTYTATATLIVDTNNKEPLASADSLMGSTDSYNYITTQTELMLSPVVLGPVVDQLDLTKDREFAAGFSGDPSSLHEYVEGNLFKALRIDVGRGGQLMYVSASAKTAPRAALIANAVVDAYLQQEKARVNGSAGQRAERYSEQLAELRAKVAAAQDELMAFRKKKGITDVTPSADSSTDTPDSQTQALNAIQEKLLEAQNQRRALEAKRLGDPITTDEALASPQVQQLRAELRALETHLAELRTTLGAQHPKVREVESQIATTRQALSGAMSELNTNTATQLARARALEAQYQQALDAQRTTVIKQRELQGESAKLELELASAQSVYKRALDGYDQVVFAAAGRYSNIAVVSRATPPVKASKPNKVKLLLLASLVGLGLGLAGVFLYELVLHRKLRCRDDFERGLGIPVLAQFDRFSTAAGAV